MNTKSHFNLIITSFPSIVFGVASVEEEESANKIVRSTRWSKMISVSLGMDTYLEKRNSLIFDLAHPEPP